MPLEEQPSYVLEIVPRTLSASVASVAPQDCPTCAADITHHDGQVNIDDLLAVINAWGPCPAPPTTCAADIAPPGGNGVVNIDDLLAIVMSWGPCP